MNAMKTATDTGLRQVTITNDEFLEKYKPIKSPFARNCGAWDGCMFETYGPEYDFVYREFIKNNRRIWSIVEGDGGILVVTNGLHYVNRQGCLITEVPLEDDIEFLQAFDPDQEPDDDEGY